MNSPNSFHPLELFRCLGPSTLTVSVSLFVGINRIDPKDPITVVLFPVPCALIPEPEPLHQAHSPIHSVILSPQPLALSPQPCSHEPGALSTLSPGKSLEP